jgi:phosphoribosylanthranilate isomerase
VPAGLDKPIILAGGLTPDNVADAIHQASPYAVDVSSGVERRRGVKDRSRILAFIRAVNAQEAGV